jgi:hypothetical protein
MNSAGTNTYGDVVDDIVEERAVETGQDFFDSRRAAKHTVRSHR